MAKPSAPIHRQHFVTRPLRFSDIPTLAHQSTEAFRNNPVTQLLNPKATEYPDDVVRSSTESLRRQWCNPRILGVVACLSSDPTIPLGYALFMRHGDDEGALAYSRRHGMWWKTLMHLVAWLLYIYDTSVNYVWPNRARDIEATKAFEKWCNDDNELYWKSYPERDIRWHAVMIAVAPNWQGKGVGKLLLSEGLKRAQEDTVIMGLTASPEGEHLYRRMGFQLLGDFTHKVGGDEGGGIMIWYPEDYAKKVE